MTIYQCPDCGSTDLQFTQWVSLNKGHTIEGDGPLDTIWCEGCQEHQKGADAVYGPKCLCEACAHPAWDTPIPIEGVFIDGESGAVTRCDECAVYDSDESAAYALSEEMTRRGFSGFVRAYVNEYEPGEMGEYGPNYFGPDYPVPSDPVLVCPGCAHPHPDGYEDPGPRGGTHMCEKCKRTFDVSKWSDVRRPVKVSFDTTWDKGGGS